MLEVVVAPFASAMQEDYERIPLAIMSILGDGRRPEQSIAEFDRRVPFGNADGPFFIERREVGFGRGGFLGGGCCGLHGRVLGEGEGLVPARNACEINGESGADKRTKCSVTWNGDAAHEDVSLPQGRSPVSPGGAWSFAKKGRRPRGAAPGIPGVRTTSAPPRPASQRRCPAGRGTAGWPGP